MSILDWILGRDITRNWVANPNLQLIVDLDQGALSGVREDQSLEPLSLLGRAENRESAHSGNLLYYSKGLWICEIDGLMSGFEIFFKDDEFSSFVGTIRWYGQSIPLSASSTPDDVKTLLGQPDEENKDEGEIELVYAPSDDVCFGVTFDGDGSLYSIDFV